MLGFCLFWVCLELPAGRKTVQESSRQAAFTGSDSLEVKLLTWLYVQLHEAHNFKADSILSIDRVISKGIWWNPLSINDEKK